MSQKIILTGGFAEQYELCDRHIFTEAKPLSEVNIVAIPPINATAIALIAVHACLLIPCCFSDSFSGS
ncbi:hypothetical protein, partial [Fischerella thermalis]|uniref:hypothetical protein n=1 Tax=Fischerella thermalis TaxID=372787 RepID=UPI0015E1136E